MSVLRMLVAVICLSPCTFCHAADDLRVTLTGDLEGQVAPQAACCGAPRLGGLARISTVIQKLAAGDRPPLLLDAGNAFFGGSSMASAGRIIADAMDALGYDAVNVSYRDFRLGKEAIVRLGSESSFPMLSANLRDDATDDLLFDPYVVTNYGDRRVAILGLTQVPASVAALPHLKAQLRGVRIAPPRESLLKWLSEASQAADDVLLLYYGTPTGVRSVVDGYEDRLAAVLVAGTATHGLSESDLFVVAAQQGQELQYVTLGRHASEDRPLVQVRTISIDPTVTPDSAMQRLLANSKKTSN